MTFETGMARAAVLLAALALSQPLHAETKKTTSSAPAPAPVVRAAPVARPAPAPVVRAAPVARPAPAPVVRAAPAPVVRAPATTVATRPAAPAPNIQTQNIVTLTEDLSYSPGNHAVKFGTLGVCAQR